MQDRGGARGQVGRGPEAADRRARRGQDLQARRRHELRLFTIQLDQKTAPKTAASLVSLAESGFYDGTTFHRVVPGFVIQGGDPTGTGAAARVQDRRRTAGGRRVHAGRRRDGEAAAEAPGTSGSQFFVVTGADAGLPPEYAVVGKVTEGRDGPRDRQLGAGDGPPSQPVVIEKVTVESS